jgi:hypothetical protein
VSLHSNIITGEGMTRDEIIKMLRNSGAIVTPIGFVTEPPTLTVVDVMERFAKLVAQHERERIFGELIKMHEIASSRHNYYLNAVLTIRARGQA